MSRAHLSTYKLKAKPEEQTTQSSVTVASSFEVQVETVKMNLAVSEEQRQRAIQNRLKKFFHYNLKEPKEPLKPFQNSLDSRQSLISGRCLIIYVSGYLKPETVIRKFSLDRKSLAPQIKWINQSNIRIIYCSFQEAKLNLLHRAKYGKKEAEQELNKVKLCRDPKRLSRAWFELEDVWENGEQRRMLARFGTVSEMTITQLEESLPHDEIFRKAKEKYESDIQKDCNFGIQKKVLQRNVKIEAKIEYDSNRPFRTARPQRFNYRRYIEESERKEAEDQIRSKCLVNRNI